VAVLKPGSHEVAADIVGRALLDQGATNLQAKFGAFVASHGDHCWRSDTAAQLALKRNDGRPYHRESIGRARRLMARRGWIGSERVYPLQKPAGALYPTTHGTTNKWIGWKALGLKSPLTRGERRERQEVARKIDMTERLEPRRARVALEPSFVALVAGIGSTSTPVTRARPRTLERHVDRERLHQASIEERAADARRRFAEWAAEHPDEPDERGPP